MRTSDGLDLNARYVASRNGAAVIVYPGSAGRSPQARMLVRHGYGVLMLDMRGYAASDGDPNAFGWGAARDIDAGVAFLRGRADVRDGRIGGLGFSVGGELMLEAAAGNTGLRAVIADGAGERSVRESALRGPAGWFSLPAYAVQTLAVTILSGDPPPPSLVDLTPQIAPRPAVTDRSGPRQRRRRPTTSLLRRRATSRRATGRSPRQGTPEASPRGRANTPGACWRSSTRRSPTILGGASLSWRGRQNPVREAVLRYFVSAFVAVVLISLLGVWLFRGAGEAEAIRDAKDQTRIAAEGSIEPVLSDALVRGDPSALAALDRVVQERVLSDPSVVRVKLWDRSGRVVYSDEPRLIGARYSLSQADLAEFEGTRGDAAVTNLSKPENQFERGFGEAARGVHARSNPERAAPALRGVLPLVVHLGSWAADLSSNSRRRCLARSSCLL